ncbi:MAG: HlyD family secretion protein [Rhodospirillaceae bacterium]
MSRSPNTIALSVFVILLIGIIGYWTADWWIAGRYIESTNNAYIRSDITTVSARVEGYVEDVLVQDNQEVKAGDLLLRLQRDTFLARIAQGRADLDKALAEFETIASRIALHDSLIAEAQAELEAMIAGHELSVAELERAKGLVADNVASVQRYDTAIAEELGARARKAGARAHLKAVRQQRGILDMDRLALSAEADEKSAALELLQIELSHTEVRAPINGIIGNRSARLGHFVRPGSHFMAIVPIDTIWVVANFKETQMTHIEPGQVAEITIDTFPGIALQGTIQSISPASGAEFSLLPPENATGNFSKIVQRIPIKITLDSEHPLYQNLRPGMSVVVEVDTRSVRSKTGIVAPGRS